MGARDGRNYHKQQPQGLQSKEHTERGRFMTAAAGGYNSRHRKGRFKTAAASGYNTNIRYEYTAAEQRTAESMESVTCSSSVSYLKCY